MNGKTVHSSALTPIHLTLYQLSGGWVIFFVIDVLKKSIWAADDYYILYFYLPGFILWILISFCLLKFFNWSARYTLIKRLPALFAAGVLAGLLKHAISLTLYSFLLTEAFQSARMKLSVPFFYIEATIIAWIVLIIYFVIEFYRSYQLQALKSMQLESELTRAQLQVLKMQLQPHFLFNTHNSIVTLMRSGKNDQAINMLLGLSELLRFSLTRSAEQRITVKEEFDLLLGYLAIERERFEDGLHVNFKIESDCEKAIVPNFILQPLVENSIKHGVSKTIGDSFIDVQAKKVNEYLMIAIYNTSSALGEHWKMEEQAGIGLRNTFKRLTQFYGDNFTFELSDHSEGVLVTIIIPYQLQ